MARRKRHHTATVSPLLSAIESFLCRLAEKLAEWITYKIILKLDPGYYGMVEVEEEPAPPTQEEQA
jgi:hypothetical protein